jgi:HSP20 family molecular chaperone IbpA
LNAGAAIFAEPSLCRKIPWGNRITAEFKDGVLKVYLPKDQTVKPKSVEVEIG